jgi:hypothetical protein
MRGDMHPPMAAVAAALKKDRRFTMISKEGYA